MSRIPEHEYNQLIGPCRDIALARKGDFVALTELYEHNANISLEAIPRFLAEMNHEGFDLHDILFNQSEHLNGWKNANDTHTKNRVFEKFFGGGCNGKAEKDTLAGEIKITQMTNYNTLEQGITVGKIEIGGKVDLNIYHSHFYNKMKNICFTGYLQEGRQLGRKFLTSFIVDFDELSFKDKIIEDYMYFITTKDFKHSCTGKKRRGPNRLLGIRSEAFFIESDLFKMLREERVYGF
jgi:hypothetical protein